MGLTADDAEELRQALLSAVVSNPAELAYADEYGQRYSVDFEMSERSWLGRVFEARGRDREPDAARASESATRTNGEHHEVRPAGTPSNY